MATDNLEFAEICARYGPGEIVAVMRCNELLRKLLNQSIAELLANHNAKELADALRLIELAKEFECGYNEVAAALRIRKQHKVQQALYREKHREEINRKSAAKMRAKRGVEKTKEKV